MNASPLLRCLFLLLLCALAGLVRAEQAPPRDIILVLDNSGSMRDNDPSFLASQVVTEFINGLDGDVRAGVVIFDHDVRLSVPLLQVDSENRQRLLDSLGQIDYRGQYTNSPDAIERALYELRLNGRAEAARSIVFLTDGIVDTGKPEQDQEKARWLREDLTADASREDIRIFAVAFTENADFQLIQTLSSKTGGSYFRALQPEDLQAVFSGINRLLSKSLEQPVPEDTQADEPAQQSAPLSETEDPLRDEAMPDFDLPLADQETAATEVVETPAMDDTGTSAGYDNTLIDAPAPPQLIEPAPAPVPEQPGSSNLLLWVAVLALAIAILVMGVLMLKRRSDTGTSDKEQAQPPVDAPVAKTPEAWLEDHTGLSGEREHALTARPMMLGRSAGSDNTRFDYLVIPKPTVGRQHALVEYRDYGFWIVDQNSVNGTFINGERISGAQRLKHGDRIRVHQYELEFCQPDMGDDSQTVMFNAEDLNATRVAMAEELQAPVEAEPAQEAPQAVEAQNASHASDFAPDSTDQTAGDRDRDADSSLFDVSGISDAFEPESRPQASSEDSIADAWSESGGFAAEEVGDETAEGDVFDITGVNEPLDAVDRETDDADDELEQTSILNADELAAADSPDDSNDEPEPAPATGTSAETRPTAGPEQDVFDLTGISASDTDAVEAESVDELSVAETDVAAPQNPALAPDSDDDDFDLDAFMDSEVFDNLADPQQAEPAQEQAEPEDSDDEDIPDEESSWRDRKPAITPSIPVKEEPKEDMSYVLKTFNNFSVASAGPKEEQEAADDESALDNFFSEDVTEGPEPDDENSEMETIIRTPGQDKKD